jgi:hypothetical protein
MLFATFSFFLHQISFMVRTSFILVLFIALSCTNKKKDTTVVASQFSFQAFSDSFKTVQPPYGLSDTTLLKNTDTTTIRNEEFIKFIPDSIKQKMVGGGKNIKYIPLVKISEPEKESYYLVKVVSGNKKAAMVVTYGKKDSIAAVLPFLIPDADPETSQISTIDKSYSISRNVLRKTKDDVITEGKDVYAYNAAAKNFTLVMTDLLDESNIELINPIDTFPKQHKWAGDYIKNKKNIVSIRSTKNPSEFLFFIHFENNEQECTGELKGTALATSSTSAVFRQGGTPCVLEFHFGASSVTLKEIEGCGSFRDIKCVFDGSFPKKKEPKPKTESKTKAKKRQSK